MRNLPFVFTLVFIAYGLAGILSGTIAPLMYKELIDIVAGGESAIRTELADTLFQAFGWLVLTIVSFNVLYRIGDFTIVYAQSKTMEDLRRFH